MTTSRNILVVEDHPFTAKGLCSMLASNGFDLCQSVDTGLAAKRAIDQYKPTWMLVDISLPDMSGFDLITYHQSVVKKAYSVVYSTFLNKKFVEKALRCGAQGYLSKLDKEEEVMKCLLSVENNQRYISARLAESFDAKDFGEKKSAQHEEKIKNQIAQLTKQERKILLLIQQGMTSKVVAEKYNLSIRTVQNHRANICEKLNLKGVNALLKFAVDYEYLLK